MRTVGLCASLGAAARLWRGLGGLPGIDLRLLLFGAGMLGRARRAEPADWRLAARLFVTRRLAATRRGLDHPATLAWLHARRPEIGLYASAALCPGPVIDGFARGVLRLHLGLLPEYRGRSAMEWSILEGRPTGVTVYFLDAGIDTGREIVLRREVPIGPGPDLAAAVRRLARREAEFFREALVRLRSPGYRPVEHDGRGRRFYAMSRLFGGVVDEAAGISRASGACT